MSCDAVGELVVLGMSEVIRGLAMMRFFFLFSPLLDAMGNVDLVDQPLSRLSLNLALWRAQEPLL